ncbi:MAG: prepilin-type N-terminal cleavage/methylation domain-containing protein [Acidobacteriota bacterium]|nr:prepilin-type N-terminal cleavage/methylation domain-containing protein [Acidobacteriota bacterium]MDH3528430.1 prepilin-type N-terminal cleavage/methylation domain-containing protein [Acidobacteriota bacterium]
MSERTKIAAKRHSMYGFSILELMIAMFILVILLSVALPTYQRSVQHARETVLKENLFQMRRAIDQYTADKGKAPEAVDDLKEAGYLREIPVDPVNLEKREWQPVIGEDPNSNEGEQGLVDVKSLAEGSDSEGVAYSDY